MKLVYSIPKVKSVVDPEIIANYIAGINDNKELYFIQPDGTFNILKYREFQLNLEDNNGSFEPSTNKAFFSITPSVMDWEGTATIRVESMLEQSKALERQDTIQMENIIFPQMTQMAANPAFVPIFIKPVKETLKVFDKDPKDWLPAQWLDEQVVAMMGQPQMQPGLPQDPTTMPSDGTTMQAQVGLTPPSAPTVAPQMPVINTPEARVASAGQTGR